MFSLGYFSLFSLLAGLVSCDTYNYRLSPVVEPGVRVVASQQLPSYYHNVQREIGLSFPLAAPAVEGNLSIRGPFGGKLKASLEGGVVGALGRALIGSLSRDVDVRAPITGAGYSRSSTLVGGVKRGPLGGLRGTGSINLDGALRGGLGRVLKGSLSASLNAPRVDDIIDDRILRHRTY